MDVPLWDFFVGAHFPERDAERTRARYASRRSESDAFPSLGGAWKTTVSPEGEFLREIQPSRPRSSRAVSTSTKLRPRLRARRSTLTWRPGLRRQKANVSTWTELRTRIGSRLSGVLVTRFHCSMENRVGLFVAPMQSYAKMPRQSGLKRTRMKQTGRWPVAIP